MAYCYRSAKYALSDKKAKPGHRVPAGIGSRAKRALHHLARRADRVAIADQLAQAAAPEDTYVSLATYVATSVDILAGSLYDYEDEDEMTYAWLESQSWLCGELGSKL